MKTSLFIAMALSLATACADGGAGTAVGNPGAGLTVQMAPPPELTLTSGQLSSVGIKLHGCGTPLQLVRQASLELTDAPPQPLPSGTWCGVTLDVGGTLEASFSGAKTSNITLEPGVIHTVTGAPFEVFQGTFVLLLGGDIWPALADLPEGTVSVGDAGHDALVQQLQTGSVVFFDADEDGELTDADEVVAASTPADYGLPEGEDDDDDD